jgi:uncharacterized membrane protein YphA (DoxX/SURF4 family)
MPAKNLLYILAGLLLMIAGYLLMTGGGSKDPAQFDGEAMFSFRRTVISPLLILAGFAVEIFAIMHKPRKV